jgi:hypothetical protein
MASHGSVIARNLKRAASRSSSDEGDTAKHASGLLENMPGASGFAEGNAKAKNQHYPSRNKHLIFQNRMMHRRGKAMR